MKFLTWITVVAVFILMVWGNVVSSTGSGLACPDWPLCHGTITPPARFEIILEWGHRLLAALGSSLMLATAIGVWKTRAGKWARVLLGVLVVQILLGATTVLLELSRVASSVHLVFAQLIWAGFILIALEHSKMLPTSSHWDPKKLSKWKRLSWATLLLLLFQIALGGWVRHSHAGLACPLFPNCGEGFFPDVGSSGIWMMEPTVAFIHRWLGILLLGSYIHLWLLARRRKELTALADLTALLLVTQICLGIATVLTQLSIPMRAIHAANGYALWGCTLALMARGGGFLVSTKR